MKLLDILGCSGARSVELKYCLANPGREYLVYLPDGGEVTVDLSSASGTLIVEWFNPDTGETVSTGRITGGDNQKLMAPFDGDAALYIIAKAEKGSAVSEE